jgi:3-deoxy-7-phosphoheptulonate synthase
MGKDKIGHKLEKLIECKLREKLNFLFISDPMHGNTYQSELGDKLKTRSYKDIMHELTHFREHMNKHDLPSGISLEATFEDVL